MYRYFFTLNISYLQCRSLYASDTSKVVVIADSGHRVQLPASNLRNFVQSDGIKGRFRLDVDANNKITSFVRIN